MNNLSLVVVRHARTALTAQVLNGCGVGAADPPLDSVGSDQAQRLVNRVREAGDPAYRVLSSPAARCVQTAAVWGQPVRQDARLCEVDFGQWEGAPPQSLARSHSAQLTAWWSDPAVAPPGGTSLRQRAEAWDSLVAELWDEPNQRCWVLVGHATTLRIAAARSLQIDLAATSRLSLPPAAVLRVRFWPDGGSSLDSLTSDDHTI